MGSDCPAEGVEDTALVEGDTVLEGHHIGLVGVRIALEMADIALEVVDIALEVVGIALVVLVDTVLSFRRFPSQVPLPALVRPRGFVLCHPSFWVWGALSVPSCHMYQSAASH